MKPRKQIAEFCGFNTDDEVVLEYIHYYCKDVDTLVNALKKCV